MWLIFSASSDVKSFQHSSRIVGPIVRWLFPHMSDKNIDVAVLVARKGAHLTEYAVLAWLLWRALRKPVRRDPRPWSWPVAGRTILIVMLYAATDEFHQLFVPSREPTVRDVLIDTTGALLGLLLLWAVHRLSRRPGPARPVM
jgi:VanZ family protein